MRERPIPFSAPLVRAILEGRKTQTRRIVQSPAKNMQRAGTTVIKHRPPGDPWYRDHVWSMRNRMGVWGDYTEADFRALCPYGQPGDRLWVREAWQEICEAGDGECHCLPPADEPEPNHRIALRADEGWGWVETWRPSIHMPRWASRLTLEVTGVRAERLQAISQEDARAEGVVPLTPPHGSIAPDQKLSSGERFGDAPHRCAFACLWDEINADRGCGWDINPWVWVVEFRRIEQPPAGGRR